MNRHTRLLEVTSRIRMRSTKSREAYLSKVREAHSKALTSNRANLSCTNLAHGYAASPLTDKIILRQQRAPNIAIVSSYNDMLSAHQPLQQYPQWIKEAAREAGATAQFAGGVPAMCDGVTQGQPGMELSLFSRDVIAMATAIALSHNMFDGTLCLGVCDKIVPGLLIGALSFGHLPTIFVPAGPMGSGLPNAEKARIRQRFAAGELSSEELLTAEEKSYHSAGTCTFYGTANSNQMLMEIMGVHLPGAAFVSPGSKLREALTRRAASRIVEIGAHGNNYMPLAQVIDEKAIVNGIVGLLTSGGSTNHTLHLVAIAQAAGIQIDWQDFADLSAVVPLLARVYPNGNADINQFHEAGGVAYLIRELLAIGLLHEDVNTIAGKGLAHYATVAELPNGQLLWQPVAAASGNNEIIRSASNPFSDNGGLRVLSGNLGRAVIKTSAIKKEQHVICAPAKVFHSQEALQEAYQRQELTTDFVAVILFQGPQANGMPELHALTPLLANLQDQGLHVALVTDGRMSGASGKVPAAIHVTPEAAAGGTLAKIRDGDMIRLDAEQSLLEVLLSDSELQTRTIASTNLSAHASGCGRELFAMMRASVSSADSGAICWKIS